MKGDHIKYKKGYKYQLEEDYLCKVFIYGYQAETYYLKLSLDGFLLIKRSYAWNGPSGPTIDTLNSLRGSLVHDGLYQLIRLGLIPDSFRPLADERLRDICREDGMSWIRSEYWYAGVMMFAGFAVNPGEEPEILTAP